MFLAEYRLFDLCDWIDRIVCNVCICDYTTLNPWQNISSGLLR